MSSTPFAVLSYLLLAVLPPQDTVSRDQQLVNYLSGTYVASIEHVKVDSDQITVLGHRDGDESLELHLAELAPHSSSIDTESYRVLGRLEPDDKGDFALTLPRWAEGSDRLYSRFAVLVKQDDALRLASHAHWATDTHAAARYQDLAPLKAKTVKGLGGIHPDPRLFPDLADLGVGHITVNISLASLLSFQQEGTLEHRYNEKDYHFNQPAVDQLDRLLKYAHDHDIVVSAIILVPRLDRTTDLGRILTHPDAVAGHYSMANVATAEGAEHYAACLRFLASRYGPSDAPQGRISHWIIHNEVDAGWVWTNAGEKAAHEYMDHYVRSLRIAYLSVRSCDPHAKVFITLTHHWNEPHQANPRRYYPSRQLLEILQQHSVAEGDFEWGVAYHPYPQNLFNPRTWEDRKSTDDFDTPQVTFKNLQVLDRWLKQPAYRYRGDRLRTLMLSEQGFHSKDASTEAQREQAAALAYAWKKLKQVDSIEAFHYHRWIDHEREGGLNLGLWTVKPGSITWPDQKKLSWKVFQALDTTAENDTLEFALPIIGISDWEELKP